MKLDICVLGSSSAGNSTVIWDSTNAIMVDCGLNPSYTIKEMNKLKISLHDLSGVLITHLHSDHVNEHMLKKLISENIPIICHATLKKYFISLSKSAVVAEQKNLLKTFGEDWFLLDNFGVQSFRLNHDSPGGCYGYKIYKKINDVTRKVTIVTDTGALDNSVIKNFYDSDIIVLESNHDIDLLKNSGRPPWLQKRIRKAHVSNNECADLIASVIKGSNRNLQSVLLAHISQDCNTNDLAYKVVRERLNNSPSEIYLTYKDKPSEKLTLR